MSVRRVDPLAAVYAEALGQVAEARGGEDMLREIGDALHALGQVWAEERELRAYFLSAMVPQEKKTAGMDRLLADLPPLLGDFVRLLMQRGRGRMIDKVATAYEAWLDERLGRVPVTLTTALPVPADLVSAWVDRLRAATGKEPVLRHVVKPQLIAGAILQVGDAIADGSARRRLAELRKHVRERGKHALQA